MTQQDNYIHYIHEFNLFLNFIICEVKQYFPNSLTVLQLWLNRELVAAADDVDAATNEQQQRQRSSQPAATGGNLSQQIFRFLEYGVEALQATISSWRPLGQALGPLGLLDFFLCAQAV